MNETEPSGGQSAANSLRPARSCQRCSRAFTEYELVEIRHTAGEREYVHQGETCPEGDPTAGPTEVPQSTEEVEGWLEDGRTLSFEQWLDALAVCRSFRRWDLVERCGHGALEAALDRSLSRVRLMDAARAVVASAVPRSGAGPDWFGSAAEGLSLARGQIAERRARAKHSSVQQLLDDLLADLDKMLLLIVSDVSASRTQLAGLLRKYDRSDLAENVALQVLAGDPENAVALTTLGASQLDQGDLSGLEHAQRAVALGGGSYARAVVARGLRLSGATAEALVAALSHFRSDPSHGSACLLAAAAHAGSDLDALSEAQSWLSRHGEDVADQGSDRHVRLLAADQLMRDKDWSSAEAILRALLAERAWFEAANLLAEVFRRRMAATSAGAAPVSPPGG